MKNLIIWLNRIITKHKALKRWKRIVTVLAAIMTFVTTYALILPAITVERNKVEDVGGMYLEQEADTNDMLEENALEPIGVSIAADHENAATYAYADDSMTATAVFGTDEEIPAGAELVVTSIDPESEEYISLSSRSAELLDKEFIYDVTTCSFYDFALVCDNIDVTPKTGLVDIQIIFHDNTVEHLDDTLFAGRFARQAGDVGGFAAMAADDTDAVGAADTLAALDTDATADTLAADNSKEVSENLSDVTDELVSVNPDESSVIELTNSIITVLSLKGNDLSETDSLVGILAGNVDEEIKTAATETDAEIPDYDDSQEENAQADSAETDGEEVTTGVGTLKAAGSDYTVTLTYDATSEIPEGASLIVFEIAQNSKEYKNYLEKTKKAMGLTEEEVLPRFAARFFDIKIMVEGKEFTPESGVSVEITYAEPLAENPDTEVSAVHFANKKAEAEVIDANTSEVQDDGTATAQFTAESFSVYGIVYTVDFYWEVDGKVYEFSIPGGGFVSFTDLVELLGIARQDADADFSGENGDPDSAETLDGGTANEEGDQESTVLLTLGDIEVSEETRMFVTDVESITFSSPDLLSIAKAEMNTTVASIKDDLGLVCEYSADLTEEQIDEINAQAVEAGDWALISLKPFESEETLTVTMKDGDVFTIRVTDAMYDVTWSKPGETSTLLNFQEWVSFGWIGDYQTRQSVRVYYVDQNGHRIAKPSQVAATTNININNNWNNDAYDYPVSSDTVAKEIDGYTYLGAHADQYDGESVDLIRVIRTYNYGYTYSAQLRNGNTNVDGSSIYLVYDGDGSASLDNTTTVHFGYMDGDSFVEFPESMKPSDAITATNQGLGWHHLIYDFFGTDDDGPFQYRYSGTYYSANGETDTPVINGTQIQPLLRYYGNNWTYFTDMGYSNASITTNQNWKTLKDDSDIYVVYDKPTIPPGGSPTLKPDGQLPDDPSILKESAENGDGTNTLSLSITGSRGPMVAEKVADVIVILDLSTSMKRAIDSRDQYNDYQSNPNSRFYQAKQALQRLANNLYSINEQSGDPQYRLGLITFSNMADIKQLPTDNRQVFQDALDNITGHDTEEGTNWEHSLMLANQLEVPTDRATYIVFITDGAPTVRQTRLNLTDVQLDGYVRDNKNEHGDIFHGGLNNGGFYDNTNGYLSDRKHFRDYLGNGSFGGIMDDAEWGRRNREAAIDEVESIIDHHKGFFAIGVSNDAASLEYFVENECGLSSDHYELVSSESGFLDAIDSILIELDGMTGQADVRMFDGITSLTQTISKVNQEENRLIGAEGNFTYWKSNPPQVTWNEVKATWSDEQKEGFNLGVTYASSSGTPAGYATWSKAKQEAYELGKQSVATSEQTAKSPADLWAEVWESWNKSLKDAYSTGVEYRESSATPAEFSNWSDEQKAAYAIGKKVTFSEWTTRETDGCAAAVYNTATDAVEWNMGETFMLEDGITYKVSFICWPSQEAYDIIAKLNNGTLIYGDTTVYDQDVWDQFEGDITSGYTLKTNDEGANTTYRSATIVNNKVTAGDLQDPLPFQEVPPMPLEKDKINVTKTWQASRIDTQDPESVVLQVVGDDELYKEFDIEPTEIEGDSDTYNKGRSGDIYISCGHLKVNKTTGAVVVYESGHDFTLREVEENSRHWDLDASVCRPMVINTVPTMLVLVDNAHVPPSMPSNRDYHAVGNNEYYRIDGKVYKDTKAWADITGNNSRRSFLDLAKEILVADQVSAAVVDPKFTYKITINVDPTTLSWDPDIEKYVIISIVGDGYSPAAAIADETYPTTAVLPSESGLDPSLVGPNDDNRYLVAESGAEFYLSIKNGWSVRFLNLPVGTTYSIEEVLPAGSDYLFNNVRLETRKDRTSEQPLTSHTYYLKKIDGSISETSTLYKVVYQNEPKEGSLQITKSVQVDGQSTNTSYADGVYTFTITDSKGNPAIGKVNGNRFDDGKVRITVTNGVSSSITVTDLPIGEYTITEDTPENEATLVAFAVNGQSKQVQNGLVVNDNDKKITIVANETATASFTNNVNTTQLEVHKLWTDDNPKNINGIEYTIQRIRYKLVDNEGQKEWVVWDTQSVNDDFVAEGFTGEITGDAWEEEVIKLAKRDYLLDEERHEYVYVKYRYYVKELTDVPGYNSMITGGEVENGEHAGEYSFTIRNEPLGPIDQNTQLDVKKLWYNTDGSLDTDPHKNDTIYFTVTQKKYEANVTYTDNTGTHQAMLYPITVNLLDGDIPTDEGTQGTGIHPKSELSTVVYVPAGAEYTFIPHYEGGGYGTHRVYGAGFTSDDSGNHQASDHRFTIDHVNSATEVTLTVYSGHDRWATVNGYRKWTFTMESPQGIIWHLEELQEKVLQNISDATHTEAVPKTTIDYECSMKLTKDEDGLPTIIDTVGTQLGFGKGSNSVMWEGSITGLRLYEYREEDEQGGVKLVSYIYTYEVKEEVAIDSDTVNTADPPAGWDGQSAIYFVKWEQDEDKTSDTYGLWTLTNQKKPPINVTLYKVDKNNIPDSSSRLEGAEFKLVKKKLVRTGEEGNYRWIWAKDTNWGTEAESAVIPESSQNPGSFSFSNLDAGYYEIVETKRPKGYIQADENPVFQVVYNHNSVEPNVVLVYASGENIGQPISGNKTDLVAIDYRAIVVGNEHGAVLPRTGGIGTTIFYLIGTLLTGIAGASLVLRKRRRTV